MRPPTPTEAGACHASGLTQIQLFSALTVAGDASDFQQIHQRLMACGDPESACAAAVGGMAAVFEAGHDFHHFAAWQPIAQNLLSRHGLSPRGRAALSLQLAIVQLIGSGDLPQASRFLETLEELAEQANSDALRICHAAAQAYCDVMSGRLLVAEAVISDALPLCQHSEAQLIPELHLQASLGLLNTVRGHHGAALKGFDAIVGQPRFDNLPDALWLVCMGHRLLALAASGSKCAELTDCADKIRARSIPKQNHYQRSYLHYALGAAALLAGQPETALFHADKSAQLGKRCHSVTAHRTPTLLRIQALHDLGRQSEALALIASQIVDWQADGANLLVASARIEQARLLLQQGRVSEARQALKQARRILPPGENLPCNLRSGDFVGTLLARLETRSEPRKSEAVDERPVHITTFGNLQLSIQGRIIYDRDWRGNRGKTLLKALIVLGGQKISVERLCDLLWPDADGDFARNNLKVALWRLRRLGHEPGDRPLPWIALQQGQVSLVSCLCRVDCFEFEQRLQAALSSGRQESALQALQTYTEDFLSTDDSAAWIIDHREALRQRYLNAVFSLAEACLDQSSPIDPRPLLASALRLAPADPRGRRLLARLQAPL